MPKPPKKPIIYSPTFAIRAFAVMLQHCEHTELLTDFSKMGEAIIKHHDSYIWVTVEQELVGFFFIFSFKCFFQPEQEITSEQEYYLSDELLKRARSLFPNKFRSCETTPGATPYSLKVNLLTPPTPKELDALKALFDDLAAKYSMHYIGNYDKKVKADQAAREEQKQKEKMSN